MVLALPGNRPFTEAEQAVVEDRLGRVFGLTSFSLGLLTEPSLAALEAALLPRFPAILKHYHGKPLRYRMRARRSHKAFPMKAQEVEIHFADILLAKYPRLKLDLDEAELTVRVEIRQNLAFICFDQIECPGGLPVGSSSPALALLSGGIDSPVASYLMIGRGCRLNFLTFHSYPYTPPELLGKVAGLVTILNQYQPAGRLFASNLLAAQKIIRDGCAERFRTVLYRRLMFRVAEKLAAKLGDEALVTGESVGQVASQTVRNLDTIDQASAMLVLRPLLGMDKDQTITLARKLGTFEVSNIPCADSCTVFRPRRPATNAPRHLITAEEAKLDLPALLTMSLESITEVEVASGVAKQVPWFREKG